MAVMITGRGIVSALGVGVEENWKEAFAGRTSVRYDHHVANELREQIPLCNVAQVPERDKAYELAKIAFSECIESTGLSPDEVRASSLTLAQTCPDTEKIHEEAVRLETINKAKPDTVYRTMMSYVAAKLSKRFKLEGSVIPVSSACNGSALALHIGYALVNSGVVDRCICGGTERISPQVFGAFKGMQAVLTSKPPQENLLQPFGADRSGIVLGEASGFLVLESESSAVKRNAKVYGQMLNSSYQNVPTAPWGDIPDKSIWQQLIKSTIGDVIPDYIIGHATSTTYGDGVEGNALMDMFPNTGITSLKTLLGHTLSSSTIVDAILLTSCFEHQAMLGVGGDYELDPLLSNLNLIRHAETSRLSQAIKLTAGFGGSLSCQHFSAA